MARTCSRVVMGLVMYLNLTGNKKPPSFATQGLWEFHRRVRFTRQWKRI